MTLLDVAPYYAKLARNEVVTPDEIAELVKAFQLQVALSAYLASCHAATAESLPFSATRSTKGRMRQICQDAAAGLDGEFTEQYPTAPSWARDRCKKTVALLDQQIAAHDASKASKAGSKASHSKP